MTRNRTTDKQKNIPSGAPALPSQEGRELVRPQVFTVDVSGGISGIRLAVEDVENVGTQQKTLLTVSGGQGGKIALF